MNLLSKDLTAWSGLDRKVSAKQRDGVESLRKRLLRGWEEGRLLVSCRLTHFHIFSFIFVESLRL